MENKTIMGILAIIFGILIIVFPITGQFVLSVISGIGIIIFSLYLIAIGSNFWSLSKWASIAYLTLGILALIFGIMLLGNILLFDMLVGLYFYIIGFIMLFTGVIGLVSREAHVSKCTAGLMSVLGILTLFLGYFSLLNPIYVALIFGISLIIDGIGITTT